MLRDTNGLPHKGVRRLCCQRLERIAYGSKKDDKNHMRQVDINTQTQSPLTSPALFTIVCDHPTQQKQAVSWCVFPCVTLLPALASNIQI